MMALSRRPYKVLDDGRAGASPFGEKNVQTNHTETPSSHPSIQLVSNILAAKEQDAQSATVPTCSGGTQIPHWGTLCMKEIGQGLHRH